jgi:hypothetical protein
MISSSGEYTRLRLAFSPVNGKPVWQSRDWLPGTSMGCTVRLKRMSVINFENHQCRKIRAYLDSYLNDELLVETTHEVLRHLEGCGSCAAELGERLRLRQALRQASSADRAPDRLRDRIRQDVRRHPRADWRKWMLAAAVIAVVFGGLMTYRLFNQPPRLPGASQVALGNAALLRTGLDNHVHCAIDSDFADRRFTEEEMVGKLGAEFSGLVPIVRGRLPQGFELVVGHRCRSQNRQFVHLILRKGDEVASLVITRKNGEAYSTDEAVAVVEASGLQLHRSSLDGYQVSGFETSEYLAYFVSKTDRSDDLQLAAGLAPAVRDFLARLTV